MITIAEIQAKCSPELLASHDYDAIATAVNAGRTRVETRLGGIGTVMETLGPVEGAALLDSLEAMAATNSAVKWAFVLINRGELDFGSPATRAMIDLLVPSPAKEALLDIATVPDPVTPGDVELAMKNPDGTYK